MGDSKFPVIKQPSNSRIATVLIIFAGLMFAFGFVVAPYYDAMCEFAGIGGKVKGAVSEANNAVDTDRQISVEFEATVNASIHLEFRSEIHKLKVFPGKFYTVNFYARNNSDAPVTMRAIPSILPNWLTRFFKKSECFCFSEHKFEANKDYKLPVRFQIDPAIDKGVVEMTLGYTFFEIKN